MTKVLLISANREKLPYPVTPLGLNCVAQAVASAGFDVKFLDLCFADDVAAALKRDLIEFNPDLVGISLRNSDNLSFPQKISYLPDVKLIVEQIKQIKDLPIVIGGSAFSLFPSELLKYLDCDIGIIGEGEESFIKLLKNFKERKSYVKIPGLVFRQKDALKINPPLHKLKLDYLVKRDFVDNQAYTTYGGMGNLQSKRGCAFRCNYCTYPLLEGQRYRLRDPLIVADELRLLHEKYGIKHVFFVDNVFNAPSAHAAQVCQQIIKKQIKIGWSCFAAPVNIDRKLLALMKAAGCTNIEFGSDALSAKVLKALDKSFGVSDIINASEATKAAGIDFAHYIMFGAPGENPQTLKETFGNISRLKSTAVIAMVGIRIYPNTGLARLSVKQGLIKADNDLLQPHFYISPEIDLEVMLKQITDFAQANSNFVVPGMGIRSSEKMFEVLRRYYKDGPLWSYLK